jgi:hypothetical protein
MFDATDTNEGNISLYFIGLVCTCQLAVFAINKELKKLSEWERDPYLQD